MEFADERRSADERRIFPVSRIQPTPPKHERLCDTGAQAAAVLVAHRVDVSLAQNVDLALGLGDCSVSRRLLSGGSRADAAEDASQKDGHPGNGLVHLAHRDLRLVAFEYHIERSSIRCNARHIAGSTLETHEFQMRRIGGGIQRLLRCRIGRLREDTAGPLPSYRTELARFGPFELDLQTGELWRDGIRVLTQRQP